MKTMFKMLTTTLLTVAVPAGAGEPTLDSMDQWGQWRGPLGTGVGPRADPPVTWSENENVRWKMVVPGVGHATPVIWGQRVFVTTAVPHGETLAAPPEHDHGAHDNLPAAQRMKFTVRAVDRQHGTVLWERVVRDEQPHEGAHETGTWASNSPVTDGEHLFAYFGSRGLYCLTLDGAPKWEKDFGDMNTRHGHGEGSSPALHGNTLVVNWDHQGDSFVVALDKRNGQQRWKAAREEITSWSTPVIVEHDGRHQVVIAATDRVRSYDLASGKVIWECGGLSRNVVASPVAADGFVYVGNSYDWQAMMAIRLAAARGDITDGDAVVWKLDRHTPYVPSPLLYGERLYFLKHNQGFLTCLEARTGKPLLRTQRLPGISNVFASPVGAADRVYIVSRNGHAVVIEHGPDFEVLARNSLDDSFSASPAIVGEDLFLRGEHKLYCISNARKSAGP